MMVMVDYPYPSNFVANLPAWPVNVACSEAAWAKTAHMMSDYSVLYGTAAANKVYADYADTGACLNTSVSSEGGIDQNGWNVLYCNEIVQPFASRDSTSLFPAFEWDPEGNTAWCEYAYNETPQYNWVFDYYGGKNVAKDFQKLSNVVFSNGELDPWHSGGVLTAPNDKCVSLYIENSAHHLDLREPNELDPQSVKDARQIEMQEIAKWIDQYQGTSYAQNLTKVFQ